MFIGFIGFTFTMGYSIIWIGFGSMVGQIVAWVWLYKFIQQAQMSVGFGPLSSLVSGILPGSPEANSLQFYLSYSWQFMQPHN